MLDGDFAGAHLGWTPDELRRVLRDPSDEHQPGRGAKSIWRYGDFEFHFAGTPLRLWLIHNDWVDQRDPEAGSGIVLDRWVLARGLTVARYIAALETTGAEYHVRPYRFIEPEGTQVIVPRARSRAIFARQGQRVSEASAALAAISVLEQ
jgi:hypothetical protein